MQMLINQYFHPQPRKKKQKIKFSAHVSTAVLKTKQIAFLDAVALCVVHIFFFLFDWLRAGRKYFRLLLRLQTRLI
jgi:hypothetical protein